MFSVVLDKIYVFYLYPIPDSQQYVKTGNCRRPILSGLLCLFSFWASDPFVTSFEFGLRTLSVFTLSSLRVFVLVKCRVVPCFRINLLLMSFYLFNHVLQLIMFLINHFNYVPWLIVSLNKMCFVLILSRKRFVVCRIFKCFSYLIHCISYVSFFLFCLFFVI